MLRLLAENDVLLLIFDGLRHSLRLPVPHVLCVRNGLVFVLVSCFSFRSTSELERLPSVHLKPRNNRPPFRSSETSCKPAVKETQVGTICVLTI
jgi:hypothetical protein